MRTSSVALLTGGSDKPYAMGLASALSDRGVSVDFIGSDELNCPEIRNISGLTFLNLRGDQREDASFAAKAKRIAIYYARLLRYVASGAPPVLHVLWNNKYELFDRTALMAYYRAAGKRVVLTVHNVNAAARDRRDSWLNRWTLRIQYHLCDHLFVHTEKMKRQLVSMFDVPETRVTVIPFGLNDTIPRHGMTRMAARQQLGVGRDERTLLFFGQIAPYKGLAFLVESVKLLAAAGMRVRLIIAGKVKRGNEEYWSGVQRAIEESGVSERVIQHVKFIPDADVEPYFQAADVVVIPYLDIFQSGVPFLAFSFGVPVIATDVGSLREDVTSETGLLCKPRDAGDLARAIQEFFDGDLYGDRAAIGQRIRAFAAERHSWQLVAERTCRVYVALTPRASVNAALSDSGL